jgi:hypothetical protein
LLPQTYELLDRQCSLGMASPCGEEEVILPWKHAYAYLLPVTGAPIRVSIAIPVAGFCAVHGVVKVNPPAPHVVASSLPPAFPA